MYKFYIVGERFLLKFSSDSYYFIKIHSFIRAEGVLVVGR